MWVTNKSKRPLLKGQCFSACLYAFLSLSLVQPFIFLCVDTNQSKLGFTSEHFEKVQQDLLKKRRPKLLCVVLISLIIMLCPIRLALGRHI